MLGLRLHKLLHISRSGTSLRGLLRHRVLAAVEHRVALGLGCRTLVDVGANRGQLSLAWRSVVPNGRILAFEPLRRAADDFRRLFAGDPQVQLFTHAVGTTAGTVSMNVARHADSSSLLPITGQQTALYPGTELSHQETVAVRPLADVLRPERLRGPVLLKVDVQGFEMEVLRSCGDQLDRIDHVYCECSFRTLYGGQPLAHEVVTYLASRGFALAGVYNVYHDGSAVAVQADFLFSRAAPRAA
jgi:FkbM family methyltransferase